MVLGIGVDIVEIERIGRSLERYGARFSGRLLSHEEQTLCPPVPGASQAQFVAGRFAAKEAVLKALGTGLAGANWTDVSIGRNPAGAPVAVLTGQPLERLQALGATRVHVSISHSRSYAIAQAILEAGGSPHEGHDRA